MNTKDRIKERLSRPDITLDEKERLHMLLREYEIAERFCECRRENKLEKIITRSAVAFSVILLAIAAYYLINP